MQHIHIADGDDFGPFLCGDGAGVAESLFETAGRAASQPDTGDLNRIVRPDFAGSVGLLFLFLCGAGVGVPIGQGGEDDTGGGGRGPGEQFPSAETLDVKRRCLCRSWGFHAERFGEASRLSFWEDLET
jgi:hypothetical protein